MAKPCEYLRPLADFLLTQGNVGVDWEDAGLKGLWFRDAVDLAEVCKHVQLPRGVYPWETLDRSQVGVQCIGCSSILGWPGEKRTKPEICDHFKPIVQALNAREYYPVREDIFAWDETDLVLNFGGWVDLNDLRRQVNVDPSLKEWRETDTHYELQEGLTCSQHRQAIAWPLKSHR